jgi:hypothetical protein
MDAPTETAKPRPIRREEISELLAELEHTGEGIASLCRRRGLAPWRLYEARRRAKRSAKAGSEAKRAGLAPVRVMDAERTASREGARSAPPLRVVLEGMATIEVVRDFDAATLRRVLEVLRSC